LVCSTKTRPKTTARQISKKNLLQNFLEILSLICLLRSSLDIFLCSFKQLRMNMYGILKILINWKIQTILATIVFKWAESLQLSKSFYKVFRRKEFWKKNISEEGRKKIFWQKLSCGQIYTVIITYTHACYTL